MAAIRTILYPTDLSESSAKALGLARALARDYGARLIALTVYPPPLTGAEAVDRGRPGGDIADDLLSQLREVIPADPRGAVDYLAVEGHPAKAILQTAADEKCDLIVMGTHGRGGVSRLLMGSVAEAVSRGAPCPVATVRA